MPFIIKSSKRYELPVGWTLIDRKKLEGYRSQFVARHYKLRDDNQSDPQLNFESDIKNVLKLNMKFFNTLIQQAPLNYYFVAHYTCDPDFQNLNIAICIKEKGSAPNGKDEIRGKIYNLNGTVLPYEEFCKLRKNYNGRRDLIGKHTSDYSLDREGRAHMITELMKGIVDKISLQTEYMYLYFIVDDYPDGIKHISVAFSDVEIHFEKEGFVLLDDAYDHGSACCPIG